MDINKISTHAGCAARAAAFLARCQHAQPCPPTRVVKGCAGSDADPNVAARRGMDFWAFLERENRRHPGTVARAGAGCEGAGRARGVDEGRVVSYGMPRLGAVPGSGDGAGPAARVVPVVSREFFTPVGTRLDLLA